MIARRYDDLDAWQLSFKLSEQVVALTRNEPMRSDRRFCDQLLDASSSAPANLAEGFARFQPREFARYASIAKGSLAEVQNHLRQARTRGYVTDDECTELSALADRAIGAITRLIRYLQSPAAARNAARSLTRR